MELNVCLSSCIRIEKWFDSVPLGAPFTNPHLLGMSCDYKMATPMTKTLATLKLKASRNAFTFS